MLCSSFLLPPSGELMQVLVDWSSEVIKAQYSNRSLKSQGALKDLLVHRPPIGRNTFWLNKLGKNAFFNQLTFF